MALKDWKIAFPTRFGYSWVRLDGSDKIGVVPVWKNGIEMWTLKGNNLSYADKVVSTQKKGIYLAKKYMRDN